MDKKSLFKFSFFQYIKSLFAKWFLYLGFIPYLYDFLSVYLPEPLKSFRLPTWVNIFSIFIAFLLASYFSWLELKDKLKTFLDNETSFDVVPYIYKLTAIKYLEETENKIKDYEREIELLKNRENQNYSLGVLPLINLFNRQPTEEDYSKWIEDKKAIIRRTNNFISKNKKIFLINFTISASRYDENIDIGVYLEDSVEFIDADDNKLPWKEESSNSFFGVDLKSLVHSRALIETESSFWKNISIKKHSAECNLRYLKKDFAYYFMGNYFFIKTNNDEINFKIHLNSKNSNGVKEYNKKIALRDLAFKDLLDIKEELS